MKAIADDRAVAFLGSGLSLAAGLPDWPGLLKELAGQARDAGQVDDREYQQLVDWAGQNDFLMLADALVHLLGRSNFVGVMKERFGGVNSPTDVHRELTRVPFAAYVTTNYDTLLEDAWSKVRSERLEVFTYDDRSELRDPFRNRRPFLVKVHGDIHGPDTLVLGLQDFRRVIHEERAYREFMEDVLRRYSLVFLGYSLSDPDVLNMLDELVTVFDGVPGQHFALVEESRITGLRAGVLLRNYGIRVVTYRKSAPNHPEVLEFVKALSAKAPDAKAKQLRQMPVVVADEAASRPIYEALGPLFQLNLRQWTQVGPLHPLCEVGRPGTAGWAVAGALALPLRSPAPAVPTAAPAPAAPVVAPPSPMESYCHAHLKDGSWARLAAWYAALPKTAEGRLLRANLDRECARTDVDPEMWVEFLERLAAAGPEAGRPFAALQAVIHGAGPRYLLRGRPIETHEMLCRYLRLGVFETLAGGPSALRAGELLLGAPGGPTWCTFASFSQGKDATAIAGAVWRYPGTDSVVEICYRPETLGPADFLRVATVPDIYHGRADEANVLKPEAGAGDWCGTVKVEAGPEWKVLAPAAVHPAMRVGGVGAMGLSVRVVR